MFLEFCSVGVVELETMPMPFFHAGNGVGVGCLCLRLEQARVESEAHGPAHIRDGALVEHQVNDGVFGAAVEFRRVGVFMVEYIAGKLDAHHLHPQAQSQVRNPVFTRPTRRHNLAFNAPLAKSSGDNNAIQPGKRMLSSMTPTIFEKNGKLFMVAGTPGGSTIITAVFQVFVNVAEFHMPLDQAIEAKRFHHQWLPDEILIEEGSLTDQQKSDLAALGHQFREVKYMAIVKAIQVLDNGRLQGCGDPRNPDDTAKGY